MKKIVLILILLLIHVTGFSQYDNLKFKHYTTDNGLSQASIYQIYQDKKGFIWLATWDGLNRFDGYQFTVFKPNLNDKNSIKGSRISSIIEDDSGFIWVGTYEALNKYDPSTHQFKQFYVHDKNGNNLETRYNPFYIDNKQELWFSYQTNKLASINLLTYKLTYYHFADSAMQHYTSAEVKTNATNKELETIYSSGSDGLHILNLKNKEIQYYFSDHKENRYGTKKFIWHVVDDGNMLWLCTQDDLYSFDKLSHSFKAYPFSGDGYKASAFTSSAIDRKNMLWCATEGNGLWLFDLELKEFVNHFSNNLSDPNSLNGDILNAVFADKEDNIWVNADPMGIDKANPYQQFFRIINSTDQKNVSHSKAVWSLCPLDHETVIICFNQSGPMLYNFSTGERMTFSLPNEFKKTSIYHVVKDNLGQLWMATDFGLYFTRDTFKHIQKINDVHSFNVTLLQHFDSMLLGTENGLLQFSVSDPLQPPVIIKNLADVKVNTFTSGSERSLLISTIDNYLIACDRNYHIQYKKKFPFVIKCIYPIADSIIWLGSNLGLIKYDLANNQYHSFTEADGLANQYIYGIQEDMHGKLWLSSNKGIICFNPRTEEIINFDIANGLQGWEFNTRSYCKMENGTMLFGGANGLNYFTPELYAAESFNCNLELIKVVINNQEIPLQFIQNPLKPFFCKPNQNSITMEFVALDFMKSNSMNYFYKLHQEDDWISLGTKRTLQLVNMKPGNYELHIQVRASNKAVSSKELKLYFEIEEPFYQRWWFYGIFILLAGLIFYSIYFFKIKSVKRIEFIRNKLSRDLHDDIGSTLSSINILSRTAQRNAQDSDNDKIKMSLEKINERSQRLLSNMSDIIWNINPANDSTEEMISRMREYATTILEAKGINYHFDFPVSSTLKLPIESKSNLYLIFKEAVNNLSKYSGCTHVKIKLNLFDKKIYLCVEDNGKGFDMNELSHLGGLHNMQHRADELKGELLIHSKIGEGTKIILTIKL